MLGTHLLLSCQETPPTSNFTTSETHYFHFPTPFSSLILQGTQNRVNSKGQILKTNPQEQQRTQYNEGLLPFLL